MLEPKKHDPINDDLFQMKWDEETEEGSPNSELSGIF